MFRNIQLFTRYRCNTLLGIIFHMKQMTRIEKSNWNGIESTKTKINLSYHWHIYEWNCFPLFFFLFVSWSKFTFDAFPIQFLFSLWKYYLCYALDKINLHFLTFHININNYTYSLFCSILGSIFSLNFCFRFFVSQHKILTLFLHK